MLFFEFLIFRFSNFWNFGFSDFGDWSFFLIWKNKGGVKIPLSEAELSLGTPKGVITARKKSHSTKKKCFFDIFRIFGLLNF